MLAACAITRDHSSREQPAGGLSRAANRSTMGMCRPLRSAGVPSTVFARCSRLSATMGRSVRMRSPARRRRHAKKPRPDIDDVIISTAGAAVERERRQMLDIQRATALESLGEHRGREEKVDVKIPLFARRLVGLSLPLLTAAFSSPALPVLRPARGVLSRSAPATSPASGALEKCDEVERGEKEGKMG